jgi:hypothetical protein
MLAARPISRKGKMIGMGFDALVLRIVGHRSGEARKSPLSRSSGQDGSWLIVAAAGAEQAPIR